MLLTQKYRLYRCKYGSELHNQIDVAGIIYNRCIALHKRYRSLYGKSLNTYQLKKHVTRLKKRPENAFWSKLGSQAIQDIVFRIDKAYQLFFRNLKAGLKTAPPGFKKVKKYTSFTLTQAGWAYQGGNRLRIGSRTFKFSYSRPVEGKIKTLTIKRNRLGELFVCFAVETEHVRTEPLTGNSAGFDFGLKTFLSSSDGELIAAPQFFKQSQKELARVQKRFARTKQGSGSHRTLKRQLASLHETIANRRRDWHFKLADTLTDTYVHLFFETLNLRGMKKLWGRKVSDLGFYSFLQILQHVAHKKGKRVDFIDRWYPSTKSCNGCGHKNDSLTLNDRLWRCAECGCTQDRDTGAALNILREGIRAFCGGDVRRALPAVAA